MINKVVNQTKTTHLPAFAKTHIFPSNPINMVRWIAIMRRKLVPLEAAYSNFLQILSSICWAKLQPKIYTNFM